MACFLPAVEFRPADSVTARADIMGGGIDTACLQSGAGSDYFEDRAGRVETGYRPVQQRMIPAFKQFHPLCRGAGFHEDVRVERGGALGGEEIAVFRVHNYYGAVLPGK